MGCGKSKHSVETATTIIKSINADGTKQTTATKTVKETTAGSSLIQKEEETKSLCVEDTNKKPAVDPSDVFKTDNVAPTLAANVEEPAENGKEEVKVNDSNPTENAAPASAENAGKAEGVVRDETVNSFSQTDANNVSNVVPTTKTVKEDVEKRESTVEMEAGNAKIDDVVPTNENKIKESTDIKTKNDFMTPTKTEFMTPTLSEDVMGPFEVVKGEEEVKDSKEATITTTTSDEKLVKTIDGPSNPKEDNLKVEEPNLVVRVSESTKVETKKEDEDVVVTESDIAMAKIAPVTKTEKVPTANGANTSETQEKEA